CCLLCLNSSFLLILVFFMIRLPPSSTLFPYTTLFRSLFFRDRQIVPIAPLYPRAQVVAQLVVSDQVQGEEIDRSTHADLAIRDEDRKSTRLNSSHLVISYAVFCLKKKIERLTLRQMLM